MREYGDGRGCTKKSVGLFFPQGGMCGFTTKTVAAAAAANPEPFVPYNITNFTYILNHIDER